MDIVRPNKNLKLTRKTQLIATLVVVTLVLFFLFNTSSASFLASRDSFLIGTVQRGDLNISVRGTGVLAPEDIRWIATNVPGRIERVLRKAGAIVKKGDLLLALSNPQLQQALTESQWELKALAAQTQAQKVSLESDLLDQEIAVINEKLNLDKAQLTLDALSKLLAQDIDVISKIAYEEVKIDVMQFRQIGRAHV